jgi:hypothetical protein
MVDALTILVPHGLDQAGWSLLLTEARRHRCEGVLGAALAFLAQHLEAPVPAEVLATLAAGPHHPADDRFFRFLGRLPAHHSFAWRLEMIWRDYRRCHDGTRTFPSALGFPAWLGRRWGADTLPIFALELAHRLKLRGR